MIHVFIINPFAGQMTFADDLRTKLKSVKGLEYFVFNSRHAGNEIELVKKIQHIFNGEQIRFYSCGGSGTMRNMLNGIENLENTEVAFFPCGLTNDFMKIFGKDAARFQKIEELINGDVVQIDYIKSNHGIALNTFSTGLDTICVEKMNQYRLLRFIGNSVPYILGVLSSIFMSSPQPLKVTLDDTIELNGKYIEVFMGNGCVLGGNLYFGTQADVSDGKGIFRLIGNKYGFRLLPTLIALTGKKTKKYLN